MTLWCKDPVIDEGDYLIARKDGLGQWSYSIERLTRPHGGSWWSWRTVYPITPPVPPAPPAPPAGGER